MDIEIKSAGLEGLESMLDEKSSVWFAEPLPEGVAQNWDDDEEEDVKTLVPPPR